MKSTEYLEPFQEKTVAKYGPVFSCFFFFLEPSRNLLKDLENWKRQRSATYKVRPNYEMQHRHFLVWLQHSSGYNTMQAIQCSHGQALF